MQKWNCVKDMSINISVSYLHFVEQHSVFVIRVGNLWCGLLLECFHSEYDVNPVSVTSLNDSVSVLTWIVTENNKIKIILRRAIIVPVAIKLTF